MAAAIIGPILGAAGQIGGGALAGKGSQVNPSDLISSTYNPALDYALQAANYDALNQIGFGMLGSIPDPFEQIAGRINAASVDNKTKRRALNALQNIASDPTLLDDPYGLRFSRDEVFQANKSGAPFGRVVTRGPEGSGLFGKEWDAVHFGQGDSPFAFGGTPVSEWVSKNVFGAREDTEPTGLPIKSIGRLNQALAASGMSLKDLAEAVQEQKEFEARKARLKAAGLDRLGEETIINRARANAASASLLGSAAGLATGNYNPEDPALAQLFSRDNRLLDNLQSRVGMLAQFGGISPAAASQQLTDAQLDQNLRILEQSLTSASGLQNLLSAGTATARGASSQQINSASIAAQQAQAANALRAQGNAAGADSFGNAIAGGLGALGSGISNAYLMGQFNNGAQTNPYGSGISNGASQGAIVGLGLGGR